MTTNGFGTAPFGVSAYGYFAPEAATAKTRTISRARKLDPRTKEPELSNGAFVEMHPVDQQVILVLTTTKGSIPGLESFGSDLSAITHVDERFARQVKTAVARDLQNLIAARKIRLLSVEVNPAGPYRIQVQYTNLIKKSEERISL